MTSSCHRCLGFPTGLVPIGFLVGLSWSILWICPSHLILCVLMNLTISAPSINLSIFMLFRILHTLSILTGSNIFLSICLSKIPRFFIFSCYSPSIWSECNDWFYHCFICFHFSVFRSFDFISFSRIIPILYNIQSENNWLKYTYRHVCCHEDEFNKKNAVWSLPENEESLF
jgi:hypothetical protein